MRKSNNFRNRFKKVIIILLATFTVNFSYAQNEFSFHVEKYGSGQPVIFIPGLISSGEVWEPMARKMAKEFECHVLTLPGYAGQPALQSAPYLEQFKDEIIRYIDHNELQNVSLVGHSIGGFLSMMIALEQHPSISRLLIVDALPFFAATFDPNAAEGFDEAAAQQYMQSFAMFDEEQIRQNRKMMAQSMTNNEAYWDRMVDWAQASDLKTEAYSTYEMLGNDLRDRLAEMNIPMVVYAAHENNPNFPQFTRESVEQLYGEQYAKAANCKLLIAENAKHFIMLDQEDWLYSQLYNFINPHN